MGANPSAQYSAMGHGSYRPLHPQHAQQQQQQAQQQPQQHAQPHYPHQAPMRHASQPQQQPYGGSVNGPAAAAAAAAAAAVAAAKNIPPNYGSAATATAPMHPVHGSQQYPHPSQQQQPGIGGAYGFAAPPASVRSSMYPAESSMGHPQQQHQQQHQQQQPQQRGPKPYPYSMQTPYSMSAQHFMSESTGQPHTNQQTQQDVPSVYQQQQPKQQPKPQPVPNQMHNSAHYR